MSDALVNRTSATDALILYLKIQEELSSIEEEMNPKKAREIIVESLRLLPDYVVESTEKENWIRIRTIGVAGKEILLNLQDAIDSLSLVWNDYQRTIT